MKKIIIFLFFIMFSSTIIMGSDALLLTELGTSARMIGIGNIEGFDQGANSLFENPAGLYHIKNIGIGAFTTKLMHEVDYRNFSIAMATDIGTFAGGYMSAGVDDIPHTYLTGDNRYGIAYNFRYDTLVTKIGYQNSLNETIHFGLTADYYKTSLDTYKGEGWNMDGGVIVKLEPVELSLTARNILRFMREKWEASDDEEYGEEIKYPFQVVLSGKYEIWDFYLLGQVKTRAGRSRNLMAMGLHYNPDLLKIFHIYGGYKEYYGTTNILNIHTVGIGLSLFDLSFDYAYESCDHAEYDTNHYFSLSMAF